MGELRFLTRITPLPCGVHDAATAYAINSLVMAPSGAAAYLSVQDVPAGIELTDTDYWTVHTDITPALDTLTAAVNSAQTAVTKVNAAASSDELFRLSNGHFSQIKLDTDNKEMITWKNQGTADAPDIVQHSTRNGSDYIACPKRLFLRFTETTARIYLYFYNLVDGVYVPDWTILGAGMYAGTNRIMNYLNSGSVPSLVIDLPDGMYMQASVDQSVSGDVLLYGWDGVKFGPAVSGITTMSTSTGDMGGLKPGGVNADGEPYSGVKNGGVVLPGSAKGFICTSGKDAIIYLFRVTGEGMDEKPLAAVSRFCELPGDCIYYIARFAPEYVSASNYQESTITGDLSDRICVFCEADAQKPSAKALAVIEQAKRICDVKWTAAADLKVVKREIYYKQGVTYNGIPYGSSDAWDLAHYVGWHVSLHTFVNAANDPNSILYTEKLGNADYSAPYYSLVCSAFATAAAGWPYPNTNHGFIYDPKVMMVPCHVPPIGSVWSDVFSHCVVPERVDQFADGCAVTAYEQMHPHGMRTTRYSNISAANEKDSFNATQGADYYDAYGWAAYHQDALGESQVPYLDFDDMEIVNGSARPYKGDKSVYTSEDKKVLINIKSGSYLYLKKKGASEAFEPIEISAQTQIDVKTYLDSAGGGSGIYYVYTDADSTQESFEYVVVPSIDSAEVFRYTAKDTNLKFSRNDFWYATVYFRGNEILAPKYAEGKRTGCCVPARADGDYSSWFVNGAVIDNEPVSFVPVRAVFYKGEYGAYTVPIKPE